MVELLAIQIQQKKNIRGLSISGVEMKISMFADDMTGIVTDYKSMQELLKIKEEFFRYAGLRINVMNQK